MHDECKKKNDAFGGDKCSPKGIYVLFLYFFTLPLPFCDVFWGVKLQFYILAFPAHSSHRLGLGSISLLAPVDTGQPRASTGLGEIFFGLHSKGELTRGRLKKQSRQHCKQDDCWPQVLSTRRITTYLHPILPRRSRALPDRLAPVILPASAMSHRHCVDLTLNLPTKSTKHPPHWIRPWRCRQNVSPKL